MVALVLEEGLQHSLRQKGRQNLDWGFLAITTKAVEIPGCVHTGLRTVVATIEEATQNVIAKQVH